MTTKKAQSLDALDTAARRVRAAEKEFNEALTAAEALDMKIEFKTEVSSVSSTFGYNRPAGVEKPATWKRLLVKRIVLEI